MQLETATIVMGAIAWVISVGLHEAGHAFASSYLGDPTPEAHGRLTLNPFAHLKPIDTAIVIPAICLVTLGWPLGAASTPIDPTFYRRPNKGRMLVALAGPAVNVALVILFGLAYHLLHRWIHPGSFNERLIQYLVLLNAMLALFNMIPIPPLDGGDVLRYFLPEGGREFLDRLRQFGFIIAIIVLNIPAVRSAFWLAIAVVADIAFPR